MPSIARGVLDPWAVGAGRALRELLESFASVAVTTDILTHALSDAGYAAPPARADELAEFAEGPLRSEITAVLGSEVADAVVDGLAPILAMMRLEASDSGVVRKSRRLSANGLPAVEIEIEVEAPIVRTSKSTPPRAIPHVPASFAPPPRSSPSLPSFEAPPRSGVSSLRIDVALASDDPELVGEASSRITGVRLAIIDDPTTLPNARVVLLDTRRKLTALRTTWPEQSAPETLVLWPAGVRERQLIEVLQPHVKNVVCVGDEADTLDVLALVAMHAGA